MRNIIPFQSGSVFLKRAKLNGAQYKHRVLFTEDDNQRVIFSLDDRITLLSRWCLWRRLSVTSSQFQSRHSSSCPTHRSRQQQRKLQETRRQLHQGRHCYDRRHLCGSDCRSNPDCRCSSVDGREANGSRRIERRYIF